MTTKRKFAVVPDTPGRAVVYIRVSAVMGRAGDDFHSPELQRSHIDRAASMAGMVTLPDPIIDLDRTGRHFNREGVDKIRALAEGGHIDAVAIYDISRFGRNVLESLLFMQWLEIRGVVVISACEQIDTSTPAGKLMLHNMLSVAQYRSDETGRNWQQLIDKRAHSGQHHGNRLSGYTSVDGKLIVDPVMGPAIEEGFIRYARGDSTVEICRYLSAMSGRPVLTRQLKRWISNRAYLGLVILHGVEMPGTHTPLVDGQTWQRAQDRMALASKEAPRNRNPSWSLVGILFCQGGCRVYRHPYRNKSTGERESRVVCTRVANRRAGDCTGIGTPLLDPIEAEVLRQVGEYVQHLKEDVGARAEALSRRALARNDADHLRRQVTENRDAIIKLTTAWARGNMDDRVYQLSIAELSEAERLAAAQLQEVGGDDLPVDPFEEMTAAEALLGLWPEMTPWERNRALKRIVRKAVIRRAERPGEPEEDRVRVTEWMF